MIARVKVIGYVDIEVPLPERSWDKYYRIDSEEADFMIEDAMDRIELGELELDSYEFERWR